jgi:hypothetical protein
MKKRNEHWRGFRKGLFGFYRKIGKTLKEKMKETADRITLEDLPKICRRSAEDIAKNS